MGMKRGSRGEGKRARGEGRDVRREGTGQRTKDGGEWGAEFLFVKRGPCLTLPQPLCAELPSVERGHR